MSEENWFFAQCKKAKLLFDTYKIIRFIVGLVGLTGLGLGTYAVYEPEPIDQPVPVIVDDPTIDPDYALKDHAHPEISAAIKRAIDEYAQSHDPQKLKH